VYESRLAERYGSRQRAVMTLIKALLVNIWYFSVAFSRHTRWQWSSPFP
jgi:hypothetical protein